MSESGSPVLTVFWLLSADRPGNPETTPRLLTGTRQLCGNVGCAGLSSLPRRLQVWRTRNGFAMFLKDCWQKWGRLVTTRRKPLVLSAAAAAAVLASTVLGSGTALAGHRPNATASTCTAPAEFTAVSVLTSSDARAVGNCWTGSVPKGLIEKWNGKRWRIVSAPSPGVGVDFEGVAAASASYAWAVGGSAIEHWNGKKWARFPEPVANISLRAVTALSVSDAWAVGYRAESSTEIQTVILHWNGKHWRRLASADAGGPNGVGYLDGVGGSSASSVWAVGYYSKPAASVAGSLIMHWNGKAWKQVPSPNPAGSKFTPLAGVSAVSSSDAWADGAAIVGSKTESVIL
jgi:hypothetical protein